MTLVERMIEKFSPPLDPSLIISLTSEISDSVQSELDLLETFSNLIQENQQSSELQSQSQNTNNSESSPSILNQVQCLFPHLPESLIQRAISNNSSDLNDIIDYLQATEYEYQDQDQDQGQPSLRSQDPSSSTQTPTRKIKKSKKPLTIHLNDVLQRETATRLKQVQQVQALNHINNAWVTGDSQIIYLSNLLGIQPGKIYSTYHSKACNLILTLEEIFSRLESSKRIEVTNDQDKLDQLKTQLDFLRTMLSNNDEESLTRLLILTDLDPGNAYDLWSFLDDLQDRHGTLPFNQFFFSNTHSSSSPVDRKTQLNSHDHMTSKKEPTDGQIWIQVSPKGTSNNLSEHSVNHCSNKLNELENKYEQTQKSLRNPRVIIGQSRNNNAVYVNKRAIQNSIAMIHREGADKIWNQVKDWEHKLVKATVRDRQRARNDLNSIDLHGLTRNQASLITSEYLNSWWNHVQHLANAYNSDYEPFRIITGAGTHSVDSKPIVLYTITRLLDQEKWKWKYEDKESDVIGSLIVYGIKKNR